MATQTPAKPAAKPAAKPDTTSTEAKPVAPQPAFSLDAVAPIAIAVPVTERSGGPGRTARDNTKVEGWLRDLDKTRGDEATSKEARQLPNLPIEAFPEVRTRFIQAARALGIGVSLTVEFTDDKGKAIRQQAQKEVPESVKSLNLIYVTKRRKQMKAAAKNTDVPALETKPETKPESTDKK